MFRFGRFALGALAILAGSAAVACSDSFMSSPTPPSVSGGGTLQTSQSSLNLVPLRTLRDDFRDIALRAPGFAGLFVENGQLVINSTAPGLSPGLRREVSNWLVGFGRPDLAAKVALHRQVSHDYAGLFEALKHAKAVAARSHGVNTFWIDERTNQVVIGVDNSASAATVARAVGTARALATPQIAAVPVDVRVVAAAPDAGLQAQFGTMGGGIRIHGDVGGDCSIGFVGWRMDPLQPGSPDLSYRIITTASHCTTSQTQMLGDNFGQPSLSRLVAVEVAEPTIYPQDSPYCEGLPQCRFADIAILHVHDSITSMAGSVAISSPTTPPSDPPFNGWRAYVGSGVVGVVTGETITKVGAFGGQTTGVVDQACADRESTITPGLWTMCAQGATATGQGGDSGGTVFIPLGGAAVSPRPAGVLFQGGVGRIYFSPIYQIENALGHGLWYYAW